MMASSPKEYTAPPNSLSLLSNVDQLVDDTQRWISSTVRTGGAQQLFKKYLIVKHLVHQVVFNEPWNTRRQDIGRILNAFLEHLHNG